MTKQVLSYREARNLISNGDLLLWQNGNWISRAIAVYGRGRSYHAGKACWVLHPGDKAVLLCLHTVQDKGGCTIPLSKLVAENPGEIAVYEAAPNGRWPDYDRSGALAWMWRNIIGKKYGWRSLVLIALGYLPLSHWIVRPKFQDQLRSKELPVCSAAVAMSERFGGGIDVRPGLEDSQVTPSDLEGSQFYKYRFHLGLE